MPSGQDFQNDSTPSSKIFEDDANFWTRFWGRRDWLLMGQGGRLLGVGLVAAGAVLVLYLLFFPPPIPLNQAEVDLTVANAMASATPPPDRASEVYDIILPSLVFIQTNRAGENLLDENGDVGVGSGVVINSDGSVLTSLHVVDGATSIKLFYATGGESEAKIVAQDEENDIAILLPDRLPQVTVPAILGNPNAEAIGNDIFAVGNPLGLAGSLSAGVISGFDRDLPPDKNGQTLTGLIQFDAAVNPGNSGGPLLNKHGQVIGIVTALANPTDQNFFIGIGFAVPINVASQAAGSPSY